MWAFFFFPTVGYGERQDDRMTSATNLDDAFLEKQTRALRAEQEMLERELARIARKDVVGEDYHARFENIGRSEDDNALEEERYEAARSSEQSLELHLRDVRSALVRLANGTYGVCAVCQSPIDRRRLEALPSATACVQHGT